ncbi:HEPN domain-containing protein [Methanotorris formicicus]|uniref:HEPN domain protein n=1 Tax=Methanotorris formicicus Mc-S-70 TaxID=647171 RepID=H1KX86_9EURY|nr:HEPN domain-containing protein [Methanotorris formicicus]EHP88517.1 HEPN domain protein [Methanotorris formicicus Mc-S-70]
MGDSEFNIKYAKLFIKRAEEDLEVANVLLKTNHYPDSIYHSQQCAEKAVKSILILNNVIVRRHIVSGIFRDVIYRIDIEESWKEKLLYLIPKIESLEEHWVMPRYPEPYFGEFWNPLDEYTKEDAEECIKNAEEVLKVVKGFLKEKYGLE